MVRCRRLRQIEAGGELLNAVLALRDRMVNQKSWKDGERLLLQQASVKQEAQGATEDRTSTFCNNNACCNLGQPS